MILDFLKDFEWETEALDISFLERGMCVDVAPNTDFWLDKTQKIFKNNCAFFYTTKIGDFEVKGQFEVGDFANFAQCGLMIKVNDINAFKVALMSPSLNVPQIGTSLTIMGYSDLAVHTIPAVANKIYYKIAKKENVFFVEFSFDDIIYHKIRQFSFIESLIELKIGAYFASPGNKEYQSLLKNIEIK